MPTFQHGVHDYSLDDFAIQAKAIRRQVASYRARFSVG